MLMQIYITLISFIFSNSSLYNCFSTFFIFEIIHDLDNLISTSQLFWRMCFIWVHPMFSHNEVKIYIFSKNVTEILCSSQCTILICDNAYLGHLVRGVFLHCLVISRNDKYLGGDNLRRCFYSVSSKFCLLIFSTNQILPRTIIIVVFL